MLAVCRCLSLDGYLYEWAGSSIEQSHQCIHDGVKSSHVPYQIGFSAVPSCPPRGLPYLIYPPGATRAVHHARYVGPCSNCFSDLTLPRPAYCPSLSILLVIADGFSDVTSRWRSGTYFYQYHYSRADQHYQQHSRGLLATPQRDPSLGQSTSSAFPPFTAALDGSGPPSIVVHHDIHPDSS